MGTPPGVRKTVKEGCDVKLNAKLDQYDQALIQILRHKMGLPVKAVAEIVGCSPGTVSNYAGQIDGLGEREWVPSGSAVYPLPHQYEDKGEFRVAMIEHLIREGKVAEARRWDELTERTHEPAQDASTVALEDARYRSREEWFEVIREIWGKDAVEQAWEKWEELYSGE